MRYAEGRFGGLEVRLERPSVVRLFVGQTAPAVIRTVPYLYTLCAQAQKAAAVAALAAAAEEEAPQPVAAALWIEALHEHFWRLLLDWPLALGLSQAKDAFIAWRAARSGGQIEAATRALLETTLLGCPSEAWHSGEAAALGSLAARCLARFGLAEPIPAGEAGALAPAGWLSYWRGETSDIPPSRRPASVAAAWCARLEETVEAALALFDARPYPVAAAGGAGWGIGQTRTARGVLTHGVELDAGRTDARVKNYQVWAPTDRHFADGADLAVLLAAECWPDAEAARQAVEQAVLALDPCLPYTVRVENA